MTSPTVGTGRDVVRFIETDVFYLWLLLRSWSHAMFRLFGDATFKLSRQYSITWDLLGL